MSKFTIDSSRRSNQNHATVKNNLSNKPTPTIINDFNNNNTRNITNIYKKRSIDKNRDVPRNNDRRNVRKQLDTTAIRQDRYNFASGQFDANYPRPSNYNLCPQKISTVFQNGGSHWSNNTTNISSSFPLKSNFAKVSDAIRLSTSDCNCFFVNFTGEYVLNWSLADGGQLVSTTNPNVTVGSFDFFSSDQYFEIFLYPKPELKNNSYIHIRYRIPIRYRYAYADWTFWESLLLDGTLSETEFVKVVNCCATDSITALQAL